MFIAGAILGVVPIASAQITSVVIQITAGTAKELQMRSRENSFLDRANQELFMPRGLFAMVMSFKDDVEGGGMPGVLGKVGKNLFKKEKLDVNQVAAKYSNPDPNRSKIKKGMDKIRLQSGDTYGEMQLPESAPLVYPYLDQAAARGSQSERSGGIGDKFRGAGEWVQDYLDRRAHASLVRGIFPSSSRTC